LQLFEPLGTEQKAISSLTELEVRSAIRRRERSGDLSEENASIALVALARELTALHVEDITGAVLQAAATVIDDQGLRALDAIQLATALHAKRSPDAAAEFQFVGSDERLLRAAEAEGLNTWNPASGAQEQPLLA